MICFNAKNSRMFMVLFSLFILFPSMVFAEDKQVPPTLYATFWALIPPIVAIALALLTKEVYSSLFIGIFIGGLFYANFSIEGSMFCQINIMSVFWSFWSFWVQLSI